MLSVPKCYSHLFPDVFPPPVPKSHLALVDWGKQDGTLYIDEGRPENAGESYIEKLPLTTT